MGLFFKSKKKPYRFFTSTTLHVSELSSRVELKAEKIISKAKPSLYRMADRLPFWAKVSRPPFSL